MSDLISVRQGSQVIPIVPHAVRRHPGLAARGLLVELHANDAAEFPERELQQHNVFLYTGSSVRAEIRSPGFNGMRWIRPGALWVMPQGSRHGVRFEGRTEGIALAFDPARFAALVETSDGKHPSQIMESLAASPPKVEHLMRALSHESSGRGTRDHFGLECIATAIALELSQQVKATRLPPQSGPRLAPRQIRMVEGYVEAHLESSITLGDLAAAVGLSSFHFLRAFRQTTGVTPRQYVLDRRMERATSLLKGSNLSVAEIGIRVGFEHACHFTRAFRRAVGMPPSLFRAELQK